MRSLRCWPASGKNLGSGSQGRHFIDPDPSESGLESTLSRPEGGRSVPQFLAFAYVISFS